MWRNLAFRGDTVQTLNELKAVDQSFYTQLPLFAHWSHSLSVANVPKAIIRHWFCNRKRFNKA
jgi:hypothetical protein